MAKRIARIILIAIGVVLVIAANYKTISEMIKAKEYESGTVLYKSEQLQQVKHATRHNMYLTVRFPSGVRDVDVTTFTYMNTNVGDQVTFEKKLDLIDFWMSICFGFSILSLVVLVCCVIFGISWVFS